MNWSVSNPLRLNLWSGPRNVSTAMLYAFAQRHDTEVVDEPLYAHYLRVSGARHPGRESVLAAQDNDGDAVVQNIILGKVSRPIRFCKQMAHHLRGLDRGFLADTVNVILTRDPREVLPTLAVQLGKPEFADTGYQEQIELLHAAEDSGQPMLVLDAKELLTDPGGVLKRLCEGLSIPFEPNMLEWPAGPRPFDGVWAPHWYHNVHRSTGFIPYTPKDTPFPDELKPILAQCQPCYEELYSAAIKAPFSAN